MTRSLTFTAAACLLSITTLLAGCAAPRVASESDRRELEREAARAVSEFTAADPGLRAWVRQSHGYAIFPVVGKGAVGIGAAYGDGLVYEKGKAIGTTALSQGSIGFQLGGQSFKEIIFFEDRETLVEFISGRFEFSANASAVAVTAGASGAADFYNGMAVFTMPNGGLMFEAAIGGQKFTYRKLD